MRCPHCRDKLITKSAQGDLLRVRGAIRLLEDGRAVGQCYWCREEVELPLQLKKSDNSPRIFVRPPLA